MTNEEKRAQVIAQCKVVVHLATALANVHSDKAQLLKTGRLDDLIEMNGERSASIMETLADILNGMDAVDAEEDAWTDPVFKLAHQLWPSQAQCKNTSQ